jgi:hypothetical protein
MCRSMRRRMNDVIRNAGTVTKTIRNAPATPIVMGRPRAICTHLEPSVVAGCTPESVRAGAAIFLGCRTATATPTASGTARARVIQTARTVHAGTQSGTGTNASTRAAAFGVTVPISRSGHAAAAATSAESHIFLVRLVSPNRATTAHPNTAESTRPREREIRASNAWMIAIGGARLPGEQAACQHQIRPLNGWRRRNFPAGAR